MHNYLLPALLLYSGVCLATHQVREVFVVEGQAHGIDLFPLESLYNYDDIQSRLVGRGWCTANWRGYKGTWELREGKLWLTSLVQDSCSQTPPLIDPVPFFGQSAYPVKASWFSEKIEVRLGDMVPTYCKTKDDEPLQTGYTYDAMVYAFTGGELVERSRQTINQDWEEKHQLCIDNAPWDFFNWIGISK
ncbi:MULTISPECIES: hypothetical protein [unclassified Pseudoalteromonas]|uniref:hypothetical protein n=1 Tax=unclassified Pseudoalteromonas TaxID=194690 RepID=UPI0020985884|nr:hypothetical protein [Pseudoalteromonas sp. XMcav2-N]MCO7188599.1 hypothetical protein [Pseudoalteromonas sp. XMcav2-N]